MSAIYLRAETTPIRFDDGRCGTQTVYVYDDGSRELSEIVVTRSADGTRCQHVYSRRRDLAAFVYDFADLGNNCKWHVTGPAVVIRPAPAELDD